MSVSQEKVMIKFIKNTGAAVHQVYSEGRWRWEVLTQYSECENDTLEGAISEAIRDHTEALRDGEDGAAWEECE